MVTILLLIVSVFIYFRFSSIGCQYLWNFYTYTLLIFLLLQTTNYIILLQTSALLLTTLNSSQRSVTALYSVCFSFKSSVIFEKTNLS